MQLKILKKGSKGPLVSVWQEFLFSEGLYKKRIDGDFGSGSVKGTKALEKSLGLNPDAVVDDELWAAAMSRGLSVTGSRYNAPPKPSFRSLSSAQRQTTFGVIKSVAAPTSRNREAIKITNGWQKNNLSAVVVPQLKTVDYAPKSGRIYMNTKAVEPVKALFQAWDDAGLMKYVLTWAGSWVPRYIRNRPGRLSSHAWGTAFDINVPWNGLGRTCAPVGKKGTVMPLVEIANAHGWYWGGHFSRPDGMHFELAKPNAYKKA